MGRVCANRSATAEGQGQDVDTWSSDSEDADGSGEADAEMVEQEQAAPIATSGLPCQLVCRMVQDDSKDGKEAGAGSDLGGCGSKDSRDDSDGCNQGLTEMDSTRDVQESRDLDGADTAGLEWRMLESWMGWAKGEG